MMATSIYAAVLALIFIGLSGRVIVLRRRHKVAIGHGDNLELRKAIRAHANFAEYVPLALLLIFMLEMNGGSTVMIHGLGLGLLVGRGVHAYSVSQVREGAYWGRTVSMTLTFLVLLTAAVGLLTTAV